MKSIARRLRSFHGAGRVLALLLALALTAQAHDPGLSTATVRVGDQQIDVLLGFARQDAAFLFPAKGNLADIGTSEAFQVLRPELESIAARGFDLYLGEQRVVPAQTAAQLKAPTNVEILLRFRRTDGARLRLVSTFLEDFPLGHREFLSVQTASGGSLGEAMLSAKKNAFQIRLPSALASTIPARAPAKCF